ncbi:MAG: hypothetical protein HYS33_04415 [Acidobacteria bacterium]|nr:hypothetical protein [Acidobacteriota bacterium]
MIHRDIRTPNLFITEVGQAKALDFGQANLARSTGVSPVDGQDARATAADDPVFVSGPLNSDGPTRRAPDVSICRRVVLGWGALIWIAGFWARHDHK